MRLVEMWDKLAQWPELEKAVRAEMDEHNQIVADLTAQVQRFELGEILSANRLREAEAKVADLTRRLEEAQAQKRQWTEHRQLTDAELRDPEYMAGYVDDFFHDFGLQTAQVVDLTAKLAASEASCQAYTKIELALVKKRDSLEAAVADLTRRLEEAQRFHAVSSQERVSLQRERDALQAKLAAVEQERDHDKSIVCAATLARQQAEVDLAQARAALEKVQEFLLILHNQDPTHDTCTLLDAVQHALARQGGG